MTNRAARALRAQWLGLTLAGVVAVSCAPTEPTGRVVASALVSTPSLAVGDTVQVTVAMRNDTDGTVAFVHPSWPRSCAFRYELVNREGIAVDPGFTCTADGVASHLGAGQSVTFVHRLTRSGLPEGPYVVHAVFYVGMENGRPLPGWEDVTSLLYIE